jgi:hypothetical protein
MDFIGVPSIVMRTTFSQDSHSVEEEIYCRRGSFPRTMKLAFFSGRFISCTAHQLHFLQPSCKLATPPAQSAHFLPFHIHVNTETDFSHPSLPYPSTVLVVTQAPPEYTLL